MAGRIEGITVEINGETTKLQQAITKLNKPINTVQRELKNVEKLLKMNPGNVDLLARKEKALADNIQNAKTKLQSLEEAQRNADAAMRNGTNVSTTQYQKLQEEIDKARITLQQLENEQNNFGTVGAQRVAAVGAKFEEAGGKMEAAGNKLKGVSVVATAALAGGAKAAIDFESAFTGVAKTVDGTEAQLQAIYEGIKDLAQSTASSTEDIAAVAEAAGQLGIATDDILEFTKVMVELGDSTNLSAEEAASALARFANVTGMSSKDYSRLGSVIVALGNNFATTESDIVAMATRLASTGTLAGFTEAQIMAIATALSSVGIEAEAGGTAFSSLTKKIQVACETGSTQLEQFASVAGMSTAEFQQAFEKDAVSAIGAFIQGLNDTERNGKSAVAVLDEMGIKDVRLSNTILALASSGDLLTDTINTANTAWSENSALTEEAQKRYETTAAKLNQAKEALKELGAEIGAALLPVIEKVTAGIKAISDAFVKLPEGVKTAISGFLVFVAALAPALIMFGKISTGIGQLLQFAPQFASLAKGFGTLFGSLKAALPALEGLGGAIASVMTGPVGIAIAAVAALTVAFVVLWKKCESFRNFFIETFEEIKAIVTPALQEIGASFSAFWTDSLLPALLAIKEALMPLIASIATSFVEYFQQIMPTIQVVLQAIVPLIQSAISLILSLLGTIVPIVQSVITTLLPIVQAGVNSIVPILQSVISVLQGIIDFLTGVFTGDWALAWSGIKQVFSGVINTISALFRAWANVAKAVVTAVKGVFEAAGKRIKSIFQAVGSAISAALTAAAATVKAVWSSVTGFFSGLWSTIKSLATSAANGIKNVWNSVVAFIRTIPGKIVSVFSSLPGRMVAVGRNIINGIIRGVQNAAQNLLSKLRSLGGQVLSTITSYFKIKSPSRVMQEVVGKNIVLGISSGIYKYADNATDAMKETSQNILSEAEKILDIQESLGELTAEQELAYWKEVKKLTGIQGEELLTIDKKIAEAEKKILDEQQKAQEEQLKEYENRVDKLAGFASIFSEVKFETVSGDKLTENLQDQVYALEEYAEIMQKLTEKGISSGLLAELQEQGVGAIDELRALARMSDDELLRYDSLYTQKMQLAAEQAAKELGQASTNIVDSVAEAVDTLNTNATIAVQSGQDNQTAMLSNISTEVANIVGQSLAGGLAGIANLIVSAMPEILRLDMDSKKVAESSWGAFGELANTRGRIFAPSESQIRDIAMNVINSVLTGKPSTT